MNRSIFNRIREAVSPALETDSGTGALTEQENACVVALLQTLSADPDFSADRCLEHVAGKTHAKAGYLKAYRDGVSLLDRSARARFADLDTAQRDAVLRKILRRYPYRGNEPRLKQRLRITGSHLDQIFTGQGKKRFREFVVRDLMGFYFQGAEGWKIAGYDEFPGHVRHDDGNCEVVKIIDDEDGRVLLELSDATIEELDPAGLIADEDFMLTVAVKSGRQRASFARAAYYQLVERIDMGDGRFVLRIGDEEIEIPSV